ncbi:MAG: flagellar motor switch protein FliG [Planctomycetes bacterium]|nr:flagellar motor switch protein FliG [Planctomycetota bacterium]MCB9872237.1 flagellar motor switch protein FliG [Planctomycetota bacterium]MCB9888055.1 flagellar motor switch protein FliG [Planctomycetota bacterium]
MSQPAAESEAPIGARLNTDLTVAVLLLAIDQELAAELLRHLGDDQVERVTRAMKELQEISISDNTIQEVLTSTLRRLREGGMALGDVGSHIESVLKRAFGEDKGERMNKRANSDILARRPFAVFESLSAEDLANLLVEEHPQIAAVFIAHLDRMKGGAVVNQLPEARRADLIYRVSTLDRTPPEVVQRVLDVMRKKVKDLGLTTLRSEPKAWIKAAAEILNNMGGGEKSIIETIGETSQDIATAIRDEMFTFDDISKLDKKAIQKVLGQIDTRALAVALKATTIGVEENIFNNLSKRAGEMVAEERESLGPMPLSEVLEAQQQILVLVRDMMDKGEISVASGGGEKMV